MIVTKLSANWFPKKERVISTMFGSNSIILGFSVGFLFPYVFIGCEKTIAKSDKDLFKS